jgi:extradiol dioxygenase family protein
MTTLALKAHLAINVHDVTASIRFYRKLFGVEPSKVRTGYAKFDLANPLLNLMLNQLPFHDTGALSHLGIQVRSTGDVLAMQAEEPVSCCTPVCCNEHSDQEPAASCTCTAGGAK